MATMIKVPRTKIREFRRERKDETSDDQDIVRSLFIKHIAPAVFPVPDVVYTVGCTLDSESDPPAEIRGRPEGQEIEGIHYW